LHCLRCSRHPWRRWCAASWGKPSGRRKPWGPSGLSSPSRSSRCRSWTASSMERTIPQFNFDDQYLRMWRMISYAQCQDHHCVTSLLDITVRHIWNKEMRCWWYITHDGWWYLVIQQIPILIPITLTLTSSIHSPLSRCHVTCRYSWSTSFTFTLT